MPSNINFTLFTDPTILWATKDAVNLFFQTVTVPNATISNFGVVKKATIPANPPSAPIALSAVNVPILNADGTVTTYTFVSKADLDSLNTSINTLRTTIINLQNALRNAGIGT